LNLSFFPFKPPLGGLFHFKKALAMTPARAFIFITSLTSNNNSDQSGNLDYLPLQILP
jgi:hypothetical protein